ncbi:MAG: PAS domain S-box protein [Candidatus Omnitrophica bacterium]|nr:PAS domain S-box protein [Candidatus Omnitrophota bacterium]
MKKKKTTDSELLEQIRALQSRINLLEKTKKNRQEVQESLRESIELYQALLEISPDAIIISDLNRRIIMVNEEAARAHGFDSMEEMIGLNILTLIAPEDRKHTQGPLKEKNFRYKKFSLLKKDGSVFPAEISLSVLKDAQGNPQAFIGMMRNLAEYNKIVDELKQKSVFENLIVSLSAKLINLDEKEVDQGINNALKAIGDFAKVDRSYIFLFSADGKKMDNTHEWCAPGIEPQIKRLQKISVDAFPWFIKNIKKQQTLYVPRVSDLPDAAGDEKKEWEAEKIKSLINVPMVFKGELIGFIGFDSVMETKEWPEEMRMLLRIMADLLAGVVKRRYMEWDIRILHKELLKTNMRLKQMALRDSLTGLFNHRYFEDAIESEFTRAKRHYYYYSRR